jgi:hypothetical protein
MTSFETIDSMNDENVIEKTLKIFFPVSRNTFRNGYQSMNDTDTF